VVVAKRTTACVQDAGNAVKRATEALVNEAQKVHSWSSSYYEESSVTVDERMVGGMAQVKIHDFPQALHVLWRWARCKLEY